MKHSFLLVLCTILCGFQFAQTPGKATENTIVKDSSGIVYPFGVWKALVMQGDYVTQPIDSKNERTEFLLVKLTEEQKERRAANMPKPRESGSFTTGKDFNLFKTKDINDNRIDLREDRGKIIVINFWFIDCPPCRMEIPALNQLVESYKGNDRVRFIAIALDEKFHIKEFLKKVPFRYAIVENGRYYADRYKVRSYPTHVIIDQEGKVYFHTTGLAMNTVYWLKKSVAELLSQPVVAQQK